MEDAQRHGFLGPGAVERHIAHALAMAECLPATMRRAVDLGSGGGVPGLVMATARPEMSFVLLDARQRRCRFLRRAVVILDLGDRVEVVEDRAESAARRPDLREGSDAVVARSFGPPAVTAECATGLLRVGGVLVVSEPPEEEETEGRWSETGVETLGLGPPVRRRAPDGSFVRLVKVRSDDRWPRRVGIPEKRPVWA